MDGAVAGRLPVAETFAFLDAEGFSLSELTRLDTLVTVVDGSRFQALLESLDSVARDDAQADTPTRPLADLLIEQVEYANVILVNKLDLLDEHDYPAVCCAAKATSGSPAVTWKPACWRKAAGISNGIMSDAGGTSSSSRNGRGINTGCRAS